MSTALSTYLAIAAAGAAATTALDLVSGMSPQEWVDGNGLVQYTPAQVSDVEALANSQSKYDPLLYPQPSVGTPIGIQTGTLIALNAQAIKDLKSKLPIGLTALCNSSGVATVDLTSYGFSSPPVVALTAITPSSTALIANITTLTSTSLGILCQKTDGTFLLSSTVQVILVPQ